MPELSNKKRKFIKRNFKRLSIAELARQTGLKATAIEVLINEYTTATPGNKQHISGSLLSDTSILLRRPVYMGAILIFVLTCLLYTPALKNGFVWDDVKYVSENTLISSLSIRSLYEMFTSFYASNWHPLTWLSLALDHAFWGLDPFGYHLTNIILHGFNVLLVFFVTMQLLVSGKTAGAIASQSPKELLNVNTTLIAAGTTALLFGLHPLHVESVAWVSERKDLLCALFFLLSILSYLFYTSSVVEGRRWVWFTICLLLFIFALLSKPMAVTLPAILLLLDIYPLKRINLYPGKIGRPLSVFFEKVPFFALSMASGIITIMAQHSGGAMKSLEKMSLSFRMLNGLHALVFYLEKMVWPHKLVPFYPLPKYFYPFDLQYILSGTLVLVITGMCLWMVKEKKYLLFIVWAYYVITLFPVLGIIKVGDQAAADRYTYLPSLGIFILLGIGVAWIFEKGSLVKRNSVLGGLGVTFICIFILLGQMTIRQIKIWHNPVILWSYVISVFPFPTSDPIAHYNLGVGYDERGQLDEAISEYAQALIINPNYVMAHLNLGIALRKKGMLDEAISEHKKVLAIKPNHPKAHNNLSVAYYYKGNYKLAILHCDKALELNCPVNPKYLALLEPYRARKTP